MRHNHARLLLMFSLFLALASSALASTTWYVNGVSGSDSNNCLSATAACKTIGHAISLAVSGDSVRVAAATYTENLSIGFSLNVIGSGASTTIIDGGGVHTVATISSGTAHVTLSKFTIRHGLAANGAGVDNAGTLIINNSVISGNVAQSSTTFSRGGGVYNHGTLTVNNSTVRGNSASTDGGGIFNTGGMSINRSTITKNSTMGDGGAIWNLGMVKINASTISGNTGGAILFSTGGGIANSSTMTIVNSTISGNSVVRHGIGGIVNLQGTLTISNSTISENAGGIYVNLGTATLQNSIVANSSGGNCEGTITSNGYNLSSDSTCNFTSTGDLNNTDPRLGPLQNNGGPTQTMALPLASPAVDAGNPTGCTDGLGHLLKTDQRGKPRPDAEDTAGCDIGAYEYQGALQVGHCVWICPSTRCGELTGYCVGSVNNACRSTYDPAQCPRGQPTRGTGSSCGELIDPTRTCTP
jgi:hypothetical protein